MPNPAGGPRFLAVEDLNTAPIATQRAALVAVLRRGPESRSSLKRILGLSSSVVTRLVQGLIAEGYVIESGTDSVGVGRPRTTLSLVADYGSWLSILVDDSEISVLMTDMIGTNIAERSVPRQPGKAVSLDDLCLAISQLLDENEHADIVGIGVGVPGIVDADGNVRQAPDLGWDDPVPVAKVLGERFGVPTVVENDVNLMLLAEHAEGSAVGHDNAVLVYMGRRGIGSGLLINGQLFTGQTGAAGEIGLIPLRLTTMDASSASFEDRFSLEGIASFLTSQGVVPGVDPVATLLAVRESSAEIEKFHAELLATVNNLIGLLSVLFDPQLVVISGAIRELVSENLGAIQHDLDQWLPRKPAIVISRQGQAAVHRAAQSMCWEHRVAAGLPVVKTRIAIAAGNH